MSTDPVVILHSSRVAEVKPPVAAAHPDLAIHLCDSYEALPDLLAETRAEVVYTVRFAGTPRFPRQALLESPTVKWISVGGSGTDHLRPWDPARTAVTNAAGVASDAMAEYALGAMLAFALDHRGFRRAQQEERWFAGEVGRIEGRTLLLVGLGRTGEAVARRAKAMDMTVLGVRANPAPVAHVDEVHPVSALPALWPRADFVVVAVPLLPATRGLVGREAFAALPPHAVLIDVSRGGVVEEAALLAALDEGRLKGAALDVFASEPLPPGHPLWRMENVMITPHCSSVFAGWEAKSAGMFAANLARWRRGEPLANLVDPARGY
ncbi:MAG: D-2-hydroxyacid dehydrogenase [Dongiaceae bacterium]